MNMITSPMRGWEGLLVLSRTPTPVRIGPRPASVLRPTGNPGLLLQVCSAPFLFLFALDNPILLVGHLACRVRKRSSLKATSCGLTVFLMTPSALPLRILGSKGEGDRNKILTPDARLLTPRHSGNSPLILRKQIRGKERGLLRWGRQLSCPAPSFISTYFIPHFVHYTKKHCGALTCWPAPCALPGLQR